MKDTKLTPTEAIELIDFDDDNTVFVRYTDNKVFVKYIGYAGAFLSHDEVSTMLREADSIILMEDGLFKGYIEVHTNGGREYTYIPIKEHNNGTVEGGEIND